MRFLPLALCGLFALPTSSLGQAPYTSLVSTNLDELGLEATCETLDARRTRCSWPVRNGDQTQEQTVYALLDGARQTVYFYALVGRSDPADDERTNEVLRHLGEYNWTSLSTKLEWNPADGTLRVSALMHTDSNFDQRAFRLLARLIGREALRSATMLASI